ncbi:hypothetical protein PRZ48_009820 [Zasmidium cellare]|uniref:Pterin-binding domain-containing protein n=1 Tax=Zasmidium cellare TaxID=395010 RepID=A0ABR0ECT6_ZASCE|nr:hypothetical protein PRZ48_009820 [Zasmidium cellare]
MPYRLQNLRCSLVGKEGPRQQSIAQISLTLRPSPDVAALTSTTPGQAGVKIQDELDYIQDIFDMVVRRFCAEMEFQSHKEVISTISEALLRVIQFRTPVLQLEYLTLDVHFAAQGDSSAVSFQSVARWKPAGQEALRDQPDSREVDVEITDLFNKNTKPEQDEDLQTENDNDGDATDIEEATATADEPPPTGPESTAVSGSADSLLASLRTWSDKLALEEGGNNFAHLATNVGLQPMSLALVWDVEHRETLSAMSRADFESTLQSIRANDSDRGLLAASRAARVLGDRLPGTPSISLSFRGHPVVESARNHLVRHLDLSVRVDPNQSRFKASLSVPGSVWQQSDINTALPEGSDLLAANYKFTFSSTDDSPVTKEDVEALAKRIRAEVETRIASIIREQSTENLDVLAARCLTTIKQSPKPLLGLLHCRQVAVTLYAIATSNPDSIKTVTKTAQYPSDLSTVTNTTELSVESSAQQNAVFVALGSNIGDRFASIESACRRIDEDPDMQIVATSALFETEPMYVEDQSRFLNGVCQINTSIEPMELLDRLQAIENDLGRVKIIDKGPRNIDLDIVAYGQRQLNTDRLVIPHRLMLEREFVLRPLSQIAPFFRHPVTGRHVSSHLRQLPPSATPMYPLTPLAPSLEPLRSLDPGRKTLIMSILNVTPDSFSDGGDNSPANVQALKAVVTEHIAAGAAIIDIGGQSSRPNAPDVTAEEEIARILPAIEAIKSLPEAANVAISVDTYRASVAEAAINAGAHIINDISAGVLDQDMLPTIARLGCTYIMMHMRGTPHTMQSEENTSYPKGVVTTVGSELQQRLEAAQAAGIRRWRIILDPGLGFAKTVEQNVAILRQLNRFSKGSFLALKYLPLLVGSSRKGFIGKITGVEKASERVAGTAATVTAAVAGGAEIVRVHDVEEMARVVRMADAIYRWPNKPGFVETS